MSLMMVVRYPVYAGELPVRARTTKRPSFILCAVIKLKNKGECTCFVYTTDKTLFSLQQQLL